MDPRLTEAVIPPLVLLGVADLGERQGFAVETWLSGTGLGRDRLDSPDTRVSFTQAATFLKRALRELPGPVGIQVGSRDALQSYGVLGLAVRSSATVADAVRLGMELHQASGSMTDAEAEFVGGEFALRLYERAPEPELLQFLCEESFFSTLLLFRSFCGHEVRPTLVEFTYPEPPHSGAYRRFFGSPLRFGADANRMSFSADLLASPIATYNPMSLEIAVQACRELVAPDNPPPDLVGTVEALLADTVRRPLTMAEIAERLYLTERGLRRRLAGSGHTFSEIRDRVRARRARFLLVDSGLRIADIAAEVGFSDPREFRRAFRRWTGEAPAELRRRHRGQGPGTDPVATAADSAPGRSPDEARVS
ncbi:AraC family transcriptional regulator [Nocardia sp. NPDC003345]